MKERRCLPPGLTPRLLSREAAAAYCGISPTTFDETIGEAVAPVELRRRKLWDIKAIDRWIDGRSFPAKNGAGESLRNRLNGGVQGARG